MHLLLSYVVKNWGTACSFNSWRALIVAETSGSSCKKFKVADWNFLLKLARRWRTLGSRWRLATNSYVLTHLAQAIAAVLRGPIWEKEEELRAYMVFMAERRDMQRNTWQFTLNMWTYLADVLARAELQHMTFERRGWQPRMIANRRPYIGLLRFSTDKSSCWWKLWSLASLTPELADKR